MTLSLNVNATANLLGKTHCRLNILYFIYFVFVFSSVLHQSFSFPFFPKISDMKLLIHQLVEFMNS